jgi:hypothetical protein
MIQHKKMARVVASAFALLLFATTALWGQTSNPRNGPLTADKNAVNSACASEASTAGCGSETVGHGLLKCIHAYKRAHKGFRISPGCRTAMKQLRADAKTRKAGRTGTPKAAPPQ